MIASYKKLSIVFLAVLWATPAFCQSQSEQIEVLVNRLKRLELDREKVHEGAGLVADKKAKKRLVLTVAAIIAINIAIWGAVKLYYHLNQRQHKATTGLDEVQVLTNQFVQKLQGQDQLIRQLRQERDDAVRDFNLVANRMRQLHGGIVGGGTE